LGNVRANFGFIRFQHLHCYRLTVLPTNADYLLTYLFVTYAGTMTPKFTTINFNRRALNVTWFVTSEELSGAIITVCYRKLGRTYDHVSQLLS